MSDAPGQKPADPGTLVKLGRALIQMGKPAQAVTLVIEALARDPDDPELRQAVRLVLSQGVPQWHAGMLRDEPRNAAFERALRRAVRPGMRVLDIGTGSGLLAMMAARAGAGEVIACERDPLLAATASEIVAANGFEGRVRVVAKASTDLDPESDLGGPVDLIVSETFSDDLLSEGAVRTLEDARRRLGRSGAALIPRAAAIRVAPAFWDRAQALPPGEVAGFDLTLFERHVVPSFRPAAGDPRLSLAGEAVDLFRFDFAAGAPIRPERLEVDLPVLDGAANGVVQWIRLDLDGEETYENRPEKGARSHWHLTFHPLGRTVEQGHTLRLAAAHDRELPRLWFPESSD